PDDGDCGPEPAAPAPEANSPEVFIGLVGPIGTDHDEIVKILADVLGDVRYGCETIRFSTLLHRYPRYRHLAGIKEEETRVRKHMKAGTEVRHLFGQGSALAQMAISEIGETRRRLHLANGMADSDDLSRIP